MNVVETILLLYLFRWWTGAEEVFIILSDTKKYENKNSEYSISTMYRSSS